MKENRSNGFDYPKSTATGTTVLEEFGEKGSQSCLLDGIVVERGLRPIAYPVTIQDQVSGFIEGRLIGVDIGCAHINIPRRSNDYAGGYIEITYAVPLAVGHCNKISLRRGDVGIDVDIGDSKQFQGPKDGGHDFEIYVPAGLQDHKVFNPLSVYLFYAFHVDVAVRLECKILCGNIAEIVAAHTFTGIVAGLEIQITTVRESKGDVARATVQIAFQVQIIGNDVDVPIVGRQKLV
jgi:hypothetical protein